MDDAGQVVREMRATLSEISKRLDRVNAGWRSRQSRRTGRALAIRLDVAGMKNTVHWIKRFLDANWASTKRGPH